MKVYCIFIDSVSENFILDGVYTTAIGAWNRYAKHVNVGQEAYIITKSLKGDLEEFFVNRTEKDLKRRGKLGQKYSLKVLKPDKEEGIENKVEEGEVLSLEMEVVKSKIVRLSEVLNGKNSR